MEDLTLFDLAFFAIAAVLILAVMALFGLLAAGTNRGGPE